MKRSQNKRSNDTERGEIGMKIAKIDMKQRTGKNKRGTMEHIEETFTVD